MSRPSSLYPEILFHFTNIEALFGILHTTFSVSYAREKIQGKKGVREFGIPMISFCDLRLSELKEHMRKYGKFGIGPNKEWANRNGLNPVWYVSKSCDFSDNFSDALNGIYRLLDTLSEPSQHKNLSDSYMKVIDTYRYIKNYEGELEREGSVTENHRFADEREWRFVPPLTTADVLPFVPISRIRSQKQKADYNRKISNVKLRFRPDDIKYLIVENESDIIDLIRHLRSVKIRFSESDIDRLSSRVLTSEQIYNDV